MEESKKLGVGIIGAGEVFQVCHGPCLLLMPHLFSMESICDASPTIVDHCAAKFNVPHKTAQPQDVLSNPKVDVVLILTSDESHSPLAVAAIEAGKFVLVEKPLTLSIPSCEAIVAAEKQANARGQRVFVGYMRRYAPSFLGAFKREIASIPRILYARVRDFSGPNARFVNESGTFPVKPPTSDLTAHVNAERTDRLERLFAEAFSPSTAQQKAEGHGSQVNGTTGPVTDVHRKYCRFLGSLGSHDISLMREALGFPEDVAAVSAHDPFYSAIFNFRNADGTAYAVTYESGIDEVPVFDAHLSVYGAKKRVTIQYDSPYVKGLPVTVEVEEVSDAGDRQRRHVVSSYVDAYTSELLELYECVVHKKPIKTSAEDALQDLKIYDMMYKAWQAGNV